MPEPYERLSQYYDAGWSDFTLQYVPLLEGFLKERGVGYGRVLDLACGTGTLAIQLALAGHRVDGRDLSPRMIEKARAKAAGRPGLSFEVGDMLKFKADGQYDMVTCTFDALNYIRKIPELKKVFRNVADVLKPGGLFVFDVNTRILYRHQAGETESRELNGETILQESRYNGSKKLAITIFSFPDATYEMHLQRPYSYDEIQPILEKTGFSIVQLFSWFSGIPYSPLAPKVFYVAEKR